MLNDLRQWRFPHRLAAGPAALPLVLLLLAMGALFLFGNDRAYFYRSGHHDWNSSRTLAMAESLSIKHNLLGFHYLSRNAVGDLYYSRHSVYNRFPLGGFALVKLSILPYGENDFQSKIYAGRMLMLMLFSASAVLAYLSLARIVGSRWDALAATLLAFSSYYMLYYSDMIFNEVSIDFFAVMLVLHAMVVFVQEGRLRQLLIKCCLALLLGWHVYAFLLPFVVFGMAAELIRSHQTTLSSAQLSVARRFRGYAMTLLRSRYMTLSAVTLLFGIAVLTFNLANEYMALGGETPAQNLPSVRSAVRRFGQNERFNARIAHLLAIRVFAADQFYRIGNMTLPYALHPYEIKDRFATNFEYRDYSIIALGALALGVCVAGLVVVRRRPQTLQLLATLTVAGFCWAVPLRVNVYRHDYESVFYIGIPLTAFVLILLCLRRLSRIRVAPFLAAAALILFVLSAAAMAAVGQSPAAITTEAAELADYAAIRELVDDDTTIWIPQRPWIARNSGAPWDQPYFLTGKILNYEDTDLNMPKVKQVGDYLLLNTRQDNSALLTPENRRVFLYDWELYAAYHNDTNLGKQIIGGDWRVYLGKGSLTYVSPECINLDEQFYLHIFPQNTADLPVDQRGRSYDNLVFAFEPVGVIRGDGSCVIEHPLPGYEIAALRTGQYSAKGQIWEGEYRRPTR